MTVDYHKLKLLITQNAIPILEAVLLIEKIKTSLS
jgi:hypothetical protein